MHYQTQGYQAIDIKLCAEDHAIRTFMKIPDKGR